MATGVICNALDGLDALELGSFPSKALGESEVRIAVHAACINFPDLLTPSGKYQVKPSLPFVLGMEGAGVVVEVGRKVASVKVGQKVMGWAWSGFFSEEVTVPEKNLMTIPEGMDFIHAAGVVIAYSTAANALLQRGALKHGETLLVHGAAGGVGVAAIEIGKLLGANVIATASSEEKLSVAKLKGADWLIDYTKEKFSDRVKEITDGKGADVILDTVGGDVFDESVQCIAWGGRLLVVGFASGRIPEIKTNRILLKGFSVVGVRALEHTARLVHEGDAYRKQMLSWMAQGHLRPHVTQVFPFEQFRQALGCLETRKAIGRIVLKVR